MRFMSSCKFFFSSHMWFRHLVASPPPHMWFRLSCNLSVPPPYVIYVILQALLAIKWIMFISWCMWLRFSIILVTCNMSLCREIRSTDWWLFRHHHRFKYPHLFDLMEIFFRSNGNPNNPVVIGLLDHITFSLVSISRGSADRGHGIVRVINRVAFGGKSREYKKVRRLWRKQNAIPVQIVNVLTMSRLRPRKRELYISPFNLTPTFVFGITL